MTNDRTVMFYFPEMSQASSLKVVQDQTSQIRGIYFTKSQLTKAEKLDYALNHAVYFLFSSLGDPSVYIGQSVNGVNRIKSHVREKEFWQFGIMFVTDNNSFDKLSIDYLEYYFIQRFEKTEYILENRDLRFVVPNSNIFTLSTLNTFAKQIEFLLESIGISLTAPDIEETIPSQVFQGPSPYKASIYLKDGKFILRKGSEIKKPIESSKEWNDGGKFYRRYMSHFENYVESGQAKLLEGKGSAILLHDIEFTSPSKPADLCTGSSNNGWEFWKGLKEKREKLG